MFKNTLFATIVLTFMTTSAFADWQYTNWKMPPDEVVKSSDNTASKPNYPDVIEGGFVEHLLSAPYNTKKFNFVANFWFDKQDQGLRMVALKLLDTDQCPNLISELNIRYGYNEPNKRTLMHFYGWKDLEGENTVSLQVLPNRFCDLRYQPFAGPADEGL
ncbi:hypothetical protein [Brucella thiophenivorans]|uniref:hypothetical protein n=1 Tax=Brucella thiophenivorans TaxID=571255 RepID=UPI000B990701|nr:hypothetical protein [Brucella thiophenivorans]